MQSAQQILSFWFEGDAKAQQRRWFGKDEQTDALMRDKFMTDYQAAAAGQLSEWLESTSAGLALVILLDQFPRNLFRATPQAFATDAQARETARIAIARGHDQQLTPRQRMFVYLPFEHSEILEDQLYSLALFGSLHDAEDMTEVVRYAHRHHEVIARFGRFPHRNAIVGRTSTADELVFLQQPGSSF
ncbi:MAG: DUF924 family protein [Sulfuriferula sp.]